MEAGRSIEREGGALPDAGLEDKPPNAEGPRLRLEGSHEAPAQTRPARDRRDIHPLEFGGLGVEEPEGAAADRRSLSIKDEEGAATVGDLFGIQAEGLRAG